MAGASGATSGGGVAKCACPSCKAASLIAPGVKVKASPAASAARAGGVPFYIAALLPAGRPKWGGGAIGDPATITYSFMTKAPSYASASDRVGFAAMSEVQRAAVREALGAWAEVANVSFNEVSDGGGGGEVRFGTNQQARSAGYAYYPGSHPSGGDVYIGKNYTYNQNPTATNYGYLTILHEIGHALGLKHPGNYNAGGGGTAGPYLPTAQDNYRYTLMSYNASRDIGAYPVAPMLYDIAAIQYLYGANMNTRTGNDTYAVSGTARSMMAIWDAGGIDTIDASAVTTPATINLAAGQFSSAGPGARGAAVNNIAIAFGVEIENAVGGAGRDVLRGNALNNVLRGGGKGDSLFGLVGDDTLYGEAGADELRGGKGANVLLGGLGNDRYFVVSGDDTLIEMADEGYDRVQSSVSLTIGDNVEELILTGTGNLDGTGGNTANHIFGTSGNNVLTGNGGDDTLCGGMGLDMLMGGDGADWLFGQGGFDTLTGGSGADVFVFRTGWGRDEITDFAPGEGDRIALAKGMKYTAQAIPIGTVLIFGNDRLRLAGMTPDQVQAAWFIRI